MARRQPFKLHGHVPGKGPRISIPSSCFGVILSGSGMETLQDLLQFLMVGSKEVEQTGKPIDVVLNIGKPEREALSELQACVANSRGN